MERSDVWFIAVTCAVLGIIVGAAWVDFWNEVNPLRDYQTLITGLAAVAAAYVTINRMTRVDERDQKRHDQLYALGLRPLLLAIDRDTHFKAFYDDLHASMEAVLAGDLRARMVARTRPTGDDLSDLSDIARHFKMGAELSPVKGASSLFGPQMAAQFETIEIMAPDFTGRMAFIERELQRNTPGGDHVATQATLNFLDQIEIHKGTIARFSQSLEQMKEEHKTIHRPASSL